jgi:Cu+-exporting ATPase
MVTGDKMRTAEAVARGVGVDTVMADVLPADKFNEVASICIGTGTDVAVKAADVVLMSGDPLLVAAAIRLARRTLGAIKGNLFWAFAYNLGAIPVAAFGLLDPRIAAGAMAFSSVSVVANSLRLRSFAPARGT